MIRAIMHGCNGAMGQTITQIAQADGELAIVAGIDPTGQGQNRRLRLVAWKQMWSLIFPSRARRTPCLTGAARTACRP